MTGYEVNRFFIKKHRIFIGPSTVYAKLASIERKGWIKRVKSSSGKRYELTTQGKRMILKLTDINREIQAFLKIILKCHEQS
jgi:DNA-binding PadR family transcriptional regulator